MPKDKALIGTRQERTLSFSADSISEEGTFVGYASIFAERDSYGTRWRKGCFTNTLKEYEASGRTVPMLWSHDFNQPIGKYTALAEDERGLRVEGKLCLESPKAKEVYALMRDGVITGLSVCVSINDYDFVEDDVVFTDVSLHEISACVCPAAANARIDEVRSDVRTLENRLRVAGLSRSMSKKYANLISKELDEESHEDNQADIDFIQNLSRQLQGNA